MKVAFWSVVALCAIGFALSIYGLILAFKASVILGVIALIVEPSPFVIGVIALFGPDVCPAIQAWANFPI